MASPAQTIAIPISFVEEDASRFARAGCVRACVCVNLRCVDDLLLRTTLVVGEEKKRQLVQVVSLAFSGSTFTFGQSIAVLQKVTCRLAVPGAV